MVIAQKSRNLCGALLLSLAGTVAGTLVVVPFSWPMGGFWADAQQMAHSGHISSVFTPCGYPALLGVGVRFGGIHGAITIQLLIYIGILTAVYCGLRNLEVDRTTALVGACLLGFYPDIVISIKKVWDTDITTVFLLSLCAVLLLVLRRGLTPARALLAGTVWGLSINVRPNFPALVLPIAFAFWFAPVKGPRARTLVVSGIVTVAVAALAVFGISALAHGSFYVPQNGPYNFYAGDNPFTQRALVGSLNAEPSIYPSLLAAGFESKVNVYDPGLRPYYMHHAVLYIRRNPSQALRLVFFKLATLLRPDTKIYPIASAGGAVKVLEALAIPLWLITLLVTRAYVWAAGDRLFFVFVVAYVGPFLLTNSDPRFRVPLDVLVLTHAIYRLTKVSPLRFWAVLKGGDVQNGFARAAH
jgi:hypothetical protein